MSFFSWLFKTLFPKKYKKRQQQKKKLALKKKHQQLIEDKRKIVINHTLLVDIAKGVYYEFSKLRKSKFVPPYVIDKTLNKITRIRANQWAYNQSFNADNGIDYTQIIYNSMGLADCYSSNYISESNNRAQYKIDNLSPIKPQVIKMIKNISHEIISYLDGFGTEPNIPIMGVSCSYNKDNGYIYTYFIMLHQEQVLRILLNEFTKDLKIYRTQQHLHFLAADDTLGDIAEAHSRALVRNDYVPNQYHMKKEVNSEYHDNENTGINSHKYALYEYSFKFKMPKKCNQLSEIADKAFEQQKNNKDFQQKVGIAKKELSGVSINYQSRTNTMFVVIDLAVKK